jgi:MFS family permease
VTRAVVGIITATFFSDVSHEMATAVLPLYLATIGLGPAALGVMEGVADFLVSLSKLGGGWVGHVVKRKRPWATLGYFVTTVAIAAIAFARSLVSLVTLRGLAWVGRGFRSPLRDYLLADAVEPTHFGRAYGLERAGDMLGAVVGPLLAALLVWAAVDFRTIILWTVVPGLLATGSLFFLTREHEPVTASASKAADAHRVRFPRIFWFFLVGVLLFGLGDFSRTFVVLLAAQGLGEGGMKTGTLSGAVLLYTLHNLVSAVSAYPVGHVGDRFSMLRVLIFGYAVGVGTNLILALLSGSLVWLVVAIALSGFYIAVEQTLEKAVVAQVLPRERRSLGLGLLACVNAVGDMVSSLYVGWLLQVGRSGLAFGIAAVVGMLGTAWLLVLSRSPRVSLVKNS